MNTELSNTSTETLSARLRSETRDLHSAIERQVDVMRPDLSQDQYRDLLQRFYGFYAALECRLASVPGLEAVCPDFASRKKVSLLERDLTALGMTLDAIHSLPHCGELPDLASAHQALGCLYVTEGATLGGAMISRHVAATLKFARDSGSAFFNSYGDQRGNMWKSLTDFINALPVAHETAVVVAARQTFVFFTTWLDQGQRS